jgi:signal transduction histidine kinase/DNA-binding response OmpR family regulator/ligand-binding sensor domain-containing protein
MNGYTQENCSFTHYSTENGLAQNTVMSIIQDKKGFMWFASWDGLHKFDGYSFKVYKADSRNSIGLSHNRISYISEDCYGYIWLLAYDDKVHRFDPSTEIFRQVPEPSEYRDINISSIKILSNGTVWLLSDKSGSIRVTTDIVTHEIKSLHYDENSDLIPARSVNAVYCDSVGNEWVLGANGIARIGNGKNDMFFTDGKDSNLDYQQFYSVFEDDGSLYFGSQNGRIWRYHKADSRFELYRLHTESKIVAIDKCPDNTLFVATAADGFFICDAESLRPQTHLKKPVMLSSPVLSVYKDKDNEFWFEQEITGKVVHYNPVTKQLKVESLTVEFAGANRALPAFHIHEDVNGYTWVHPFGGGFSYFDRQQNRLVPFYNDPSSDKWRFSNKIHAACSDRQGNLWLSTHSKDLEKVCFHLSQFDLYKPVAKSNPESLSNDVRALCEDTEQNLWVGLKDGFIRIYDRSNRYKGYLTADGNIAMTGKPVEGVVYSIIEDGERNLWFGTKGDGLICAVKQGDKYKLLRYKYDPDDIYSLCDNDIYSIHQDGNGRIWVATFGQGINYIEKTDNETVRFISHRNNLKNYPVERCYRTRFITSDNERHILVGTTVGLLIFDMDFDRPENIVFNHFMHREGNVKSLNNNDVHWITVTRNNNIYLATFGGGLNKFRMTQNIDSAYFEYFTKENGLSSDILLSMQDDNNGNLWLCSENGITKFNISTRQFENYDKENLNIRTRFSEASAVRRNDDSFMFGSSDGLLRFHPSEVKQNGYIPPIIFTGLQVRGENKSPDKAKNAVIHNIIDDVDLLTLSHKENIFSVRYAALDMTNPEHIKYACMLEGFEDDWQYVESQRVATYTNLPKGNYVLKVKSTNRDGGWVENVRHLKITILPPFRETALAYFLYALGIILIVIIAVSILYTIFRLKHKVAVEQRIADIKLRFFTDISHELRTPLTLINAPVENVLEDTTLNDKVRNQLLTVKRNADRMLTLVNQILDFRKIQNNRMKPHVSCTDVVALINKTMKNFDSVAKENSIDFVFETESRVCFLWVDEDKFDKILFNLLSNAFKYTKPGKMIRVFLREEEKTVMLGVQDKGSGIAENKRDAVFIRFETLADGNPFDFNSTGIGLSLVKELSEMHKAKVGLDSKLGEGSTFTVEFLKGRNHYSPDTEFIIHDTDIKTNETSNNETSNNETKNTQQSLMLILEDNAELRAFLRTMFEDSFTVIEAADGDSGLEKAVNFLPDIIISDVMMTGIDGLELTRQLRNNFNTSHIPIVLLTAKTTIDDRLAGLERGADDYITKPFSSVYLKARVDNILNRRLQLQDYYHNRLTSNSLTKYKIPPEQEKVTPNTISEGDSAFINKLRTLMEQNIDNGELMVEELARELAMSRSVFFKKLKALTGLSPIEFIREFRIRRAAELILSDDYTVTEVADMVGINDPRYFSKCFKRICNMTPTEYKEQYAN